MAANYDREEFRKYLQDSGAVEAVSRVFLKLYELKGNRPKSSVKFIQDRITDGVPSLTEYEKLKDNLHAMGTILQELKAKKMLDPNQLAAFDKIGTTSNTLEVLGDKCETQTRIPCRQSQIGFGNTWKKDKKEIASSIRLLDRKDMVKYTAKIKEAIEALQKNDKCTSLLKAHIGSKIYDKYNSDDATNIGFVDCICSGLEIPESTIGVYATEVTAYTNYKDLFEPIIKEYHGFDMSGNVDHPKLDWGDPKKLADIERTDNYILWTRIRCIRNVEKYPLVPKMDEDGLEKLCEAIKTVFVKNLTADEVKGDWYELKELHSKNPAKEKELIDKNYILQYGDKFLESVGATNHWPSGRAVYINKNENFFVWINEEDHLRFISMGSGSKIGDIYGRLVQALEAVKKELKFQTDKQLGFMSLCPSNLGNTIRASVMIKLPKLTEKANRTELDKLIKDYNFEIRGSSSKDTIEISNKKKLGQTEIQSIEKFCEGINVIIAKEMKLEH